MLLTHENWTKLFPFAKNCLPAILTSHKYDCHHQLEDAVDEREREHDLQLGGAEGQLDDGAAQLGVLETRLQGDGSTSEQSRGW